MMKGFNLLPKVARDGRIDDDRYFRVNSTSICFAYQISVFLNLSEEKYITLYRSEDGYLSFVVDVKSSVSSYHVNRINGGTKRPYHTCFCKNAIQSYGIAIGGRFHITDVRSMDGKKLYVTDCRVAKSNA